MNEIKETIREAKSREELNSIFNNIPFDNFCQTKQNHIKYYFAMKTLYFTFSDLDDAVDQANEILRNGRG